MSDGSTDRSVPSKDNHSTSSEAYLERAAYAVESGDGLLGIHLYLAAYEQALRENLVPSDQSLAGMGKAWELALGAKQRSLAEYIFEKLEPFWTAEETAHHAEELQRLAFDKLEEYGFDREAIEDMADMVNQDLLDLEPNVLYQFEARADQDIQAQAQAQAKAQAQAQAQPNEAAPTAAAQQTGASGALMPAPSDAATASHNQPAEQNQTATNGQEAAALDPDSPQAKVAAALEALGLVPTSIPVPENKSASPQRFDYRSLVGFDNAIAQMSELGIGRAHDPQFSRFVKMLNARHGLPGIPGLGTMLFTCPAREDANYFMVATVGELNIPAIRMRIDHNPQGQVILCVMASPDFKSRLNGISRSGFDSPTAVIIEDLDLWDLPVFDPSFEDIQGFFQMQLSRGAREAIALVQASLTSPEATVLISASEPNDIDSYFWDMIGSHHLMQIALPDAEERAAIWRANQAQHPSLRGLDVSKLVEFSQSLSRFEIFAVANESVEDAYRESLAQNQFCAVSTEDIMTRLADFQPLDSKEYRTIEDLAVENLRRSTSDFDDLLKG